VTSPIWIEIKTTIANQTPTGRSVDFATSQSHREMSWPPIVNQSWRWFQFESLP